MNSMRLPKYERGIVFLELVIAIGVLAILLSAIASLIIASYDLLGYSRTRISARHLANEKMELLRNLPYDQVAVAGGIPPGSLPQLEAIERNGLAYQVRTSVIYVDDQFDGLAPTDTLPTDYKRVRVDVSWGGTFASDATITLVSDISPRGVETNSDGGTLSILVIDANAQPVTEATVQIVNSSVVPQIDLTVETDALGRVLLPGAPACLECYQITVAKENYSLDKTYTNAEVAHPDKPPATIVDGQVSELGFVIDLLSSIVISSTYGRANNYALLANQFFKLTSAETIGTDILGEPVYKYDETLQTGSNGSLTVNDLEWGSYSLTLPAANWDFAGSNPLSPFTVLPSSTQTVSFASVAHSDNSLLLRTVDASSSAIPAVSVRLLSAPSYDEVLLSGDSGVPDFGQVFFSGLGQGIYDIEATKSGFLTTSYQATISGTMKDSIQMNNEQ